MGSQDEADFTATEVFFCAPCKQSNLYGVKQAVTLAGEEGSFLLKLCWACTLIQAF